MYPMAAVGVHSEGSHNDQATSSLKDNFYKKFYGRGDLALKC